MASKDTGKKQKDERNSNEALLVGTAKHAWPFSRGLLVQTLLNAGGSRKEAASIARHVEQQLRDQGLSPISTGDLQDLLVKVTRSESGRSLARQVARQTPVFQDIQVRSETGKMPFSRSVLARRLDDIGLDTKEAFQAAQLVDIRLRGLGLREVTVAELQDHTAAMLAEHYGEHFVRTYRFSLTHQGRVGVIGTDSPSTEQAIPFSKGILMQSLLAAGAAGDAARTLARAVQRDLQSTEDRVVTRAHIRTTVQRRLRDEAGKHVSARYALLRAIRHLPRPLVVLIGGVSGTGKSNLASEVAYRLGIPRIINTDSVREVMRAMVAPELTPTLHSSTFQAWKHLLPPGEAVPEHPDQLALEMGFREQVRQVSVGLSAIARRLILENADLVAEGVHLVPGFLDEAVMDQAIVVQVLLTLPDEEEHRARFARRAQQESARHESRYLTSFEEIRRLQDYLLGVAERAQVPVLDHRSLDELAERTVDIVLAQLPAVLRELDITPFEEEEDDMVDYVLALQEVSHTALPVTPD
ncbi:AAA family ATPase [Deinococcus radiophilus]|uniref:2-phosphoglycerate kinase n=2 Tax=Deinococcus radiophilus TaxID=32062 RepID=A0A431VR01_9DEIO|nr:AAA family ATPase [Deinococcus radiophilus]RTR25650.1 2-phosphoglycerate kinase [Deinococcus radiophilus]UFA50895.1 AAA family ATPase [Deinococcus radiophilus]